VAIFNLIIVLGEAELKSVTKNIPIFTNAIHRGIFYTFVGLVGVELFVSSNLSHDRLNEKIAKYASIVPCWMMVTSGIMYFFAGLLCLKKSQ